MNRLIISKIALLIIMAFSFNLKAQSITEVIKNDFRVYFDAIQNKDFETSLDYLVEEVFDIVPRETMLGIMEQTFNAKEIDFKFGDFSIDNVREPVFIDSISYVILNYTSKMSIKINNSLEEEEEEEEEETEEEEKMTRIMTMAAFEQQFGKENVSYNDSTNYFDIVAFKKAIATKKETDTRWRFLVVDKSKPYLLKAILPNTILEQVLTED